MPRKTLFQRFKEPEHALPIAWQALISPFINLKLEKISNEATANADKIKTFLLETIYDQHKYQVSTEIDNNEASTPIKIYRYIHTN